VPLELVNVLNCGNDSAPVRIGGERARHAFGPRSAECIFSVQVLRAEISCQVAEARALLRMQRNAGPHVRVHDRDGAACEQVALNAKLVFVALGVGDAGTVAG